MRKTYSSSVESSPIVSLKGFKSWRTELLSWEKGGAMVGVQMALLKGD